MVIVESEARFCVGFASMNLALHTLFLPQYKTRSLCFMYYAGTLESFIIISVSLGSQALDGILPCE